MPVALQMPSEVPLEHMGDTKTGWFVGSLCFCAIFGVLVCSVLYFELSVYVHIDRYIHVHVSVFMYLENMLLLNLSSSPHGGTSGCRRSAAPRIPL